MPTPNTGIPYVPEGTLDPAAGLNLALNAIDALLQCAVIELGLNSPPGSPADGDLYIVGVGTGAWSGHNDDLARYVAEGTFWQFYAAGSQVRLILNQDDGGLYSYVGSAGWVPALSGVVETFPAVVTESTTNRDADASNSGQYTRFTNSSAKTYTFDSADTHVVGDEYHGRNVGTADLTLAEAGSFTLNAPAGGTLIIPQGGTFTVKIVGTDEADVFGVTT